MSKLLHMYLIVQQKFQRVVRARQTGPTEAMQCTEPAQ